MSRLKLSCTACNDNLKIDRGCEKDSPIPGRWVVGGYESQRCPIKITNIDSFEWLRAYQRYEKGYLPNEGGWIDQSAKFNDIIDIIEAEICKIKDAEAAKTL